MIICDICKYQEYNRVYGDICQHRPSMEGTEAAQEFISTNDIEDCRYFEEADYEQD